MKEQFLHFVWQNRRFNFLNLKTVCGSKVEIIHPGKYNYHDGPDFLDARIKIGDTVWAGQVELHVNSSDWQRHKHTGDPLYKNVVLHVVYHHDIDTDIAGCPTLELAGLIPRAVYDRFLDLQHSPALLPCHHLIHEIDESTIEMWKERMLIERMEEKVQRIEQLLATTGNDWDQTALIWWFRYFGVGVNSDAFQELGMRVHHTYIAKIKDDPDQISALLFGMSGLLNESFEDAYPRHLQEIYQHLAHKWQLKNMPPERWRWKHTRPATFPSVRLAQLSSSLVPFFPILGRLLSPFSGWKELEGVRPHFYWDTHYRFEVPSVDSAKLLTSAFVTHLQVNAAVPIMLAFGRHSGKDYLIDEALDFVRTLEPESNKFTRVMEQHGLQNENAIDSQSLMQLFQRYCSEKKCLQCAIGNKILCTVGDSSVNSDINCLEDAFYI